jgi:hypothetical protein
LIFRKTGRPTENVWFYNVEGDGSSLKKARKFGSQFRNDFPDLLSKWPKRETQESRSWLVPVKRIIENNYNMTLSRLGLTKPKVIFYSDPLTILELVGARQEKAITTISCTKEILESNIRSLALIDKYETVPLSNSGYFEIIMGQSPPSRTYNIVGKGLPFLQGKAEFGEFYPIATKFCTEPTRIAEPNDILVSVRAPVGATNIADRQYAIGRGLAAIRCNPKVNPRYLLYVLRRMEMQIAEHVRDQGSGFTAIKKKQLKSIEVPVPEIDIQSQLVGLIDNLLDKAKQLRGFQIENESELTDFVPALLAKAFGGELYF